MWRLAVTAAAVWAACVVLATLYLGMVATHGGNVLSPRRAIFAALNAATLTGFEVSWADVSAWSLGGRVTLTLLVFVGYAASLVVGATALARLAGGRTTTHRPGLILLAAVLAPAAAWLVGLPGGAGLDALSAFANAGLSTAEVSATSGDFWIVLAPLSLAGVLLPTLLADRVAGRRGASPHTRTALLASAAAFVVCVVLLALVTLLAAEARNRTQVLATAAALATDARSSSLVADVDTLPRATTWALVPVILLGPAGGLGGGLSVTTAAVLVVGVWRLLRGGTVGRSFGLAALWLATLATVFAVTFVLLLWALPQSPSDRVVLLAAGAVANAGVASDRVVSAGADAFILSTAMLLGKTLPWAVLWWSATRGDEPVAVG